ncbi:MAG: hypothetical protein IKX34_05890 [Bacteroidales bacterium]|nr:hypothetical protein [Bacteroidales bacterium]
MLRRYRFFTLLWLLAVISISSCSSRQTAATLDDVETFIQDDPDSALATIRAIDTTTLTTRSLRAHYALLHAIALDKNWIDTTDVSIVMPAVEYYDRHSNGDRRAKAWYYLGRIQQNARHFDEASISFLRAERFAEHLSDDYFKSLICQAISVLYNETFFFEEALSYSQKSYSYSLNCSDTLGANASLYRIAMDLHNLEKYEESDSLYRVLINETKVHANLKASILSNFALNLVTRNEEYEQAVSLFEEVLNSVGSLQKPNYWGAYAYALTHVGRDLRANSLFKQLEALDNDHTLFYKTWKSMADADAGSFETAYHLQKVASDIQMKNVREVLKQSAIKAQKDYLEQDRIETEQKARQKQRVVWGSGILLLLVILLLILYFKRRNEYFIREKEIMLETYKDLTTQHTAVQDQYIQLFQSHFRHIGHIQEMLLYYQAKESDNNLYKELKKAIHKIELDEQSQREFEKLLDDAFDHVMERFRKAFPGKKPRYYQLVSYLFAGFSTTTICTIISHYNKHNIYVEKSRLKQMIIDSASPDKDLFLRMLV